MEDITKLLKQMKKKDEEPILDKKRVSKLTDKQKYLRSLRGRR